LLALSLASTFFLHCASGIGKLHKVANGKQFLVNELPVGNGIFSRRKSLVPTVVASSDPRAATKESSYLVDPASSHMLVSKIKPCMSKYKQVCTVKLRMAH
jgi:hypothetical protein